MSIFKKIFGGGDDKQNDPGLMDIIKQAKEMLAAFQDHTKQVR